MEVNMDTNKLINQIWTTRISRVNAERRLLEKEHFIQGINIYYSCVTIFLSIFSIVKHDDQIAWLTVFMTIGLLAAILFLNGQRYLDQSRDYRSNYTELHKLEMKLSDDKIESNAIAEIKQQYCSLLDEGCNHIPYDYYCAVAQSRGDYRTEHWKWPVIKGYFWGKSWRLLVKIIAILFPVGLYFLCGVI